jgi:hypothetical protein
MREYVIEPMALKRGTARAIGPVAYCSDGFQSVAHFRLRKIEIHPKQCHFKLAKQGRLQKMGYIH